MSSFIRRLAENTRNDFVSFLAKSPRLKTQIIALKAFHVINFACACHLFSEYVGFVRFVDGPSMIPTMSQTGELVIENNLTHRLRPNSLARGDLVTLVSPLDPQRLICKRLMGLPGDIICVDPTGQQAPSSEHVVVPKGHVWIMGDNAAASRDSRMYGPVSMSLIRGRIYARIWPWREITIFRNPITYLD
ncbi:hypothetical protein JAAARDRAFT_54014 [Jaapia argillacea MUCL 33604]|uniref:Mitochondrial inner membrane protease subunit n=1 Tax=Jaapia argillacea MUCL 33604 TaxID=933084 RepID=A0A067QMG5_9AGAM|nr:hypothetical protein JAAARDRAFT_54014 [Jaapia argillacea MUCL 33604]